METAIPILAARPVEPGLTPNEAAPANPEDGGNRFVRALGKVNPFRKLLKKKDTAKDEIKQD